MLTAKAGVNLDMLPKEVWFALGVAYMQHRLYMGNETVVTRVEHIPDEKDQRRAGWYVVRLRATDLRDFDREHWRAVLERYLTPLGFFITEELHHLKIEFTPARVGKLYGRTE